VTPRRGPRSAKLQGLVDKSKHHSASATSFSTTAPAALSAPRDSTPKDRGSTPGPRGRRCAVWHPGRVDGIVSLEKGIEAITGRLDHFLAQQLPAIVQAREQISRLHEKQEEWVDWVFSLSDEANLERKVSIPTFALESDAHRKGLLLRVVLRIPRGKAHAAFAQWVAGTLRPRRAQGRVCHPLRLEARAARRDAELRAAHLVALRLAHAGAGAYQVVLKILGKLTGDVKRAGFGHWASKQREFKRQYSLVAKIVARLAAGYVAAAWGKWVSVCCVAIKFTLDDTMKRRTNSRYLDYDRGAATAKRAERQSGRKWL
jgi:hypothetical protein